MLNAQVLLVSFCCFVFYTAKLHIPTAGYCKTVSVYVVHKARWRWP